jgi:hypothetical protein
VVQVAECLPGKRKALSSNPSTTKTTKNKNTPDKKKKNTKNTQIKSFWGAVGFELGFAL